MVCLVEGIVIELAFGDLPTDAIEAAEKAKTTAGLPRSQLDFFVLAHVFSLHMLTCVPSLALKHVVQFMGPIIQVGFASGGRLDGHRGGDALELKRT